MMLINIVIKEIQDHIKSLRVTLTILLLIVLMVAGAVFFIPEYHQRMKDYSRSTNETLEEISRKSSSRAALFYTFSFNWAGPWIYKTPNHLGFISEGHDNDLPNAFNPSAFRVFGPVKRVRTNILLWRSDSIDWALIIGIVLSFAALILVYDSICGERKQGTLRLSLVNSVSRSTIILGKFLGALVTLTTGLVISILIHLIILTMVGNIPVSGSDWLIIILTFSIAVIYISAFLLLGILISTLSREPTTSLVISLLCWVVLAIIIPRAGGLISSKIVEIPNHRNAGRQAYRLESEAIENYNRNNPDLADAPMSGYWSPGEPLERALIAGDAWSEAFDEYRNKMVNQVEIARKITLISPTACFQYGMESLAESGIFHFRSFFKQVQDFRLTTRQYLIDNYPKPLKWHAWEDGVNTSDERTGLSSIKLDFESIPKFEETRSDLSNLISRTLIYATLLIMFNVLFFTAAFVKFITYDVR